MGANACVERLVTPTRFVLGVVQTPFGGYAKWPNFNHVQCLLNEKRGRRTSQQRVGCASGMGWDDTQLLVTSATQKINNMHGDFMLFASHDIGS
eukprot:6475341-Amphidinium_carterae.2